MRQYVTLACESSFHSLELRVYLCVVSGQLPITTCLSTAVQVSHSHGGGLPF